MIGKIIRINTNDDKYPIFESKDETKDDRGFASAVIKTEEYVRWKCEITKISSTGIYTVRIISKEE